MSQSIIILNKTELTEVGKYIQRKKWLFQFQLLYLWNKNMGIACLDSAFCIAPYFILF